MIFVMACVVAFFLTGSSGTSSPSGPPSPKILSPGQQCIVEDGSVELVGLIREPTGDGYPEEPLLVDGEPGKWEPFRRPVLVARLELADGMHVLNVGKRIRKIFVDTDGPDEGEKRPQGWPVFKRHPAGDGGWMNCSRCHVVTEQDGVRTVGGHKGYATCKECHSSKAFKENHKHKEKPFAMCGRCHAVHGTKGPSLLVGPKEALCAQCHEE